MRRRRLAVTGLIPLLLTACLQATPRPAADTRALQEEVAATERAFARTMADRDHAGFSDFLAEETVFFSGPQPLHGKAAVAAAWKRFYEKPAAPFSWKPEQVEVLDSGTLAWSTGPVFDPDGKKIAIFNSVWRREAPGVWRIVFDKGNDICDCAKTP